VREPVSCQRRGYAAPSWPWPISSRQGQETVPAVQQSVSVPMHTTTSSDGSKPIRSR